MSFAPDPTITEETLEFMITDVQTQDVVYFFTGLAGNPATRRRIAKYFRDNFDLVSDIPNFPHITKCRNSLFAFLSTS